MKGAAAGLGKLFSLLAPVILVLALSFAISWPLWSLATADRRAFTIVVGAATGLVLLALAALSARRRFKTRAFAAKASAARASAAKASAAGDAQAREAGGRESEA